MISSRLRETVEEEPSDKAANIALLPETKANDTDDVIHESWSELYSCTIFFVLVFSLCCADEIMLLFPEEGGKSAVGGAFAAVC